MIEQLKAAAEKDPHIKNQDKAAVEYAWVEALEKQKEGYCNIIK